MCIRDSRSAKDPLAVASGLVNPEAGYPTPEDALQGAQDIVAEVVADDAEHVACLRAATKRSGALSVEAVDASEKTVYEAYYDFSEPLSRIPNHRILAVNRGEKEKKLKVKVRTDADAATGLLERRILRGDGPFAALLKAAIADGYKRDVYKRQLVDLAECVRFENLPAHGNDLQRLGTAPPGKIRRKTGIEKMHDGLLAQSF